MLIIYIFRSSGSRTDEESALKALIECDWQEDNSHIRRLIKETLTFRRTWLSNADRIIEVLKEYPHLKSSSLVRSRETQFKINLNNSACIPKSNTVLFFR